MRAPIGDVDHPSANIGRETRLKRATPETPEETWGKYLRTRRRVFMERLVDVYMPLVRTVAEQLIVRLPRTVELDDLISAGTFGLFKAIENYDPTKNTRFETYCRLRSRGAMIDSLRQQDWIPREARNRGSRLAEAIAGLRERLGRDPTDLEIARNVGMTLRRLRSAKGELHFGSIIPFSENGEDSSGHDGPDLPTDEDEPSDILHRREIYEVVRNELTEVERRLVEAYYFKGLTLKAIGKKEGISESRVCQIHGRMLDRLAERLVDER